jgi:hypothetical protein
MILLWLMSFLMYLAWAITQLEHHLVLEIKTMAVQASHTEAFEQAERALLECEQGLTESISHAQSKPGADDALGRCQIEILASSEPIKGGKHKSTIHQRRLYRIQVGDQVRLQSTIIVDHQSGIVTRLNWQQLYE